MGRLKRLAAVVVPVGLVVGGVAYGVGHHSGSGDDTLGLCRTHVGGLTVDLDNGQARNATLISAIAIRRGMPAHAATIALAAALQESKLRNLRGGDRDSLGLFQQRPSQGWGSPAQIMNPVHATNAFYDALDRVAGYGDLPVTEAAQRVQRSGYPTAYAVYERDARALASAMTGYSPAAFACHVQVGGAASPPAAQRAQRLRRALAPAFGRSTVKIATGGRMEIVAKSRPRGWALASYLVARAGTLGISSVSYAGREWTPDSSLRWHRGPDGSTGVVVVD